MISGNVHVKYFKNAEQLKKKEILNVVKKFCAIITEAANIMQMQIMFKKVIQALEIELYSGATVGVLI